MGWYISHGGTKHGYSYTSTANLGEKLQRAAPTEGPTLALLFGRRSGDPFEVQPSEAAAVGASLHSAARSLKVWDRNWAAMARQIGDSALLAARLGEPWRWA